MRKKITALVAAGLLFVVACSGDDDDTATDAAQQDGGGDNNANANGGGDAGDFCEQAGALFQSSGGTDPADQLAAAEALEPPAEIAGDWETLLQGSQMTDEGTANLDPNDPNAAAEFQEQYQALMEATTNVYTYLGEDCGLEGFTPPSTVPPTTGG